MSETLSDHLREAAEHFRGNYEWLEDACRRAADIIDKLNPLLTADNQLVQMPMQLWWKNGNSMRADSTATMGDGTPIIHGYCECHNEPVVAMPKDCYSTREAALAAAEKESK